MTEGGAVVPLDGSCRLPPAVIGAKAAGIDLMCREGLPVPPAFCLTTAVGDDFLAGRELDPIWADVLAGVRNLESSTGRTFGRGPRPLLLSVRGGAARSMPGLLATALNVGVTGAVRIALAERYGETAAADIAARFALGYAELCGGAVPDDPVAQLRGAIGAVFTSWTSAAACAYRSLHDNLHEDLHADPYDVDGHAGSAAVVQAMVFGNLGDDSGAGVVFSADPVTGADEPFGEWTPARQGTDLVSGTAGGRPLAELAGSQPGVYTRLLDYTRLLARRLGGPVEIEFTVESGRLWLLQVRPATTPTAADGYHQPTCGTTLLAAGTPACPGVVTGRAYPDVDTALAAVDRGEDVILVRPTTSPADVCGILAARGLVTEIGGATSHAAVLSREVNRPAVVGCGPGVAATLTGRVIIVDGTAGEVRAVAHG